MTRRIGFQTRKRPSLLKYLVLSVIVSLIVALVIATFSRDTRSELAVWLLWATVAGAILGVIEYALMRKHSRRNK